VCNGVKNQQLKNIKSSATVFLEYLRGNWRYLRFSLISVIDFYYVINKLIILVLSYTNLILIHYLKYLLIDISLFLTIRSRQMNDSHLLYTT
jgi:hypothetical protein